MHKFRNALIGISILLVPALGTAKVERQWVLKAEYVDACSCDMTCPCIFGGSPTHGFCKGATLVEIKEGNYGDVDLAGVTVLATYSSGTWIEFYVSDNATKEQTETVVEFLPVAEGFFEAPVRRVANGPIEVIRTTDKVKIATDTTIVELAPVRNAEGDPIQVLGLPAKGFPGLPYLNHTQYRTVALVYDSERGKFEFSGTNGYTAQIDATSETARRLNQSAEAAILEPDVFAQRSKSCGPSVTKPAEYLHTSAHFLMR